MNQYVNRPPECQTHQEYDYVFGPGASKAKTHQVHYSCVKAFMRTLRGITYNVFTQLENAINLRSPQTEPNGRMRRSAAALPLALSVSSLVASGRRTS